MLPSKGYFTNVRCKFYDAGSCERPYCHYKHAKKGSVQNEEYECVQHAVRSLATKISVPVDSLKELTENVSNSLDKCTKFASETATYSPTPINQLINQNNESKQTKSRRPHIPIQYSPSAPPIRKSHKSVESKFINYIPTSTTISEFKSDSERNQSAFAYTPTSASGTDNKNEVHQLKNVSIYVPTELDKNNKNSTRSTEHHYIPTSINSLDKGSKVDYQPTDIKSIVNNRNLKYSPCRDHLSPLSTEHTYSPTKQNKTSPQTAVDDKKLIDLDEDFDFINEIIQDVENDTKNIPIEIETATDKSTHTNIEPEIVKTIIDSDKKTKKSNDYDKQVQKDTDSDKESKKNSDKKIKQNSDNNKKLRRHSTSKENAKKDRRSDKESKSNSHSKKHEKSSTHHHSRNAQSSTESDRHKSKSKSSSSSATKEDQRKERSSSSSSKKESSRSHHSSSSSKSSKKSKSSKHSTSNKSDRNKVNGGSHSGDGSSKSHRHDKHSNKNVDSSSQRSATKRKSMDNCLEKSNKLLKVNDDHETPEFCGPDSDFMEYSSEDDIEEQCRRIFEDETEVHPPSVPHNPTVIDNEDSASTEMSAKKRIAHVSTTLNPLLRSFKSVQPKTDFKAKSSLMLLERYKISNQQRLQQIQAGSSSEHSSSTSSNVSQLSRAKDVAPLPPIQNYVPKIAVPPPPVQTGKVRIAHVPNVSGLLSAKSTISTSLQTRTLPQTVPKGQTRRMHIPNIEQELLDRPVVKDPRNTKIPLHVRTKYFNDMVDACLDLYQFAGSAYERAVAEEYAVFEKCQTLPIYKHSARLSVHRLQVQARSEANTCIDTSQPSTSKMSLKRKMPRSVPPAFNVYASLLKYILTSVELWENGYPRPHPMKLKGTAIVNNTNKTTVSTKDPLLKNCARCHKDYRINKDGYPEYNEECVYHYKKRYYVRGELRYGCCGSTEDGGCSSASLHVFEDKNTDNLRGYVETMALKDDVGNDTDRDYGVYALDCEMSYTTAGIELTRLTVIDRNLQVVYETMVKPFHPVVDYNTRFSGIVESHMEGVNTTLLDVQANLLHMFNSKTILIGHSLESDFRALKLIHNTVIDTSVMFPHRLGPPYKRALKNLAHDHLSKIIQNQISGHDSAEDAITCMELVLYKLNQDSKS